MLSEIAEEEGPLANEAVGFDGWSTRGWRHHRKEITPRLGAPRRALDLAHSATSSEMNAEQDDEGDH